MKNPLYYKRHLYIGTYYDVIFFDLIRFFRVGEMFAFGYSNKPPYVTYRVISKDGFMNDPVIITIPEPIMMHDFAVTENYAIIMDLPMYFRPKVNMTFEVLFCVEISLAPRPKMMVPLPFLKMSPIDSPI